MRADLRFKTVFAAAPLLLVPGLASAQDAAQPTTTPPAATNTPAPDAVGPRELQNFSLPGTSTKTTDQPTAPAEASPAGPDYLFPIYVRIYRSNDRTCCGAWLA